MELLSPPQLAQELGTNELFQDWQKLHPGSFLSHFFCSLNPDVTINSLWEVGFFDEESGKITVFAQLQNKEFAIKPADDVFKEENTRVERLELDKVNFPLEQALTLFKKEWPQQFPQEVLSSGFLTLQTLQQKTLWNFTFIAKSLKFINMKINVEDGTVAARQEFTLIQKGKRS